MACATPPRPVEQTQPSALRQRVEELLTRRATAAEWAAQDAATLKALEQVAQDKGEPPQLRADAVMTLRGLGWSAAALTPYLNDAAPEVRAAAAIAVGRAGGPDAKAALEARVEKEEDPAVREALQRALTLLQP